MPRSILAFVLVSCLAGPWSARAGPSENPRPDDPSTLVRHEARWAEVAMVPPPDSLPLAGPDGDLPDGYPRRYVDLPALRSLLMSRRFTALTLAIERFQAEFEADPRRELWMRDAVESLGLPHPREGALIEEWAKASPSSFAPLLIRATYSKNRGFLFRGARRMRETSELEVSSMEEAFEQARRDAELALAIRPGLVEARQVLVALEIARGRREQAERHLEEALRLCPSCYEIRVAWVGWALLPSWGGSLTEMEEFATSRADPGNPRHRALSGWVDFERADEAMAEGERDEGLAGIDRACARGEDWRFLSRRAEYRRHLGDEPGRMEDVERAIAQSPNQPVLHFKRAWALSDAGRWEEAGLDLLYVLRSEPTSAEGIWLLPRVVQALDVLGWRAHQQGNQAEARRLYDLARALAPDDAGIAQRSAAVPGPGPSVAEGARSPAVSLDVRPDLTVVVVDAEGLPLEGARVVLEAGEANWEHLARMLDHAEDAPHTDVAGRYSTRMRVGVCTIAAVVPGERGRASAVSVKVESTGAEARLVLDATARIEGKVVDGRGHPVPGITVLAIPDVDRLGPEPRALAWALSGSDGVFSIPDLDRKDYQLLARGAGYAGSLYRLGEGGPRGGQQGLTVQVHREIVLHGRVLLSEPGQAPVAAERFDVWGLPFGNRSFSSPDGRFSVSFGHGTVHAALSFTVNGRPPVVRVLDLIQDENDVGDVLVGRGRPIRGLVVDPQGAPVAGVKVRQEAGAVLAHTTRSGAFLATVPDGPVELLFESSQWLRSTRKVGEDEDSIEVQLRAGAKLRLLATGVDGDPVPGAQVSVFVPNRMAGCNTDATGRCEVAGLEGGDYLIVPRPLAPGALAPASIRASGEEGGELGVRIRWPRARTRLSVQVVDPSGEEGGASVFVFPGAPGFSDAMEKAGRPRIPYHPLTGRTPLENLAPDRYTVVALAPSRVGCALAIVELKGGDERELSLTLGDGSCP